ncbi:uncharacterized protein LOC122357116 isoform X2 [Puntigrus tetrazona]|nr:uncharacterized protein LOC122357116 isoform X2 [Puntigrus tetrazona]XP_043112333.1 uncharacterized protein LOC122357116 isoform X2 [Puntigrus tetrazona]
MSVVLAEDGPPRDCCIAVYNTRISPENILSFTSQDTALCPVEAVRFLTRFNKVICSDPESIWAKRVMKIVIMRTTTTSAMCSTITTNTSPNTVTTDITSGTDTEISTSDGRTADCCTTVTNIKLPVENIVHYDMQEANLCLFRAIRFHTIRNIIICSDPDSIWAKKAKGIVDGRITIKTSGQKAEISKTTIRSTSVTKDKQDSSVRTATTFTPSTTKDCCLTVTKNKPAFHEIVDYRIQEMPLCSLRAVLFITVENKTLCSSPVEDWVQDYIQNLNKRRKTTEFTTKRIKDQYKNTNNHFCLKKEEVKHFCVTQL